MTETVESLTHLGLGKTDRDRLISGVLPGEEIEVRDDGSARILAPSPERVAPPCRHFKSCGGCSLQHASPDFVAQWKQGIVQKALRAHGLDVAFRPVLTSPAASRRRAKFAGRRTKKGALVGFHSKASDVIIETPDCCLVTPALQGSFEVLRDLTGIAASRKGEIALTVTESEAGLDIVVDTNQALTPQLRADLAILAQRYEVARLTWSDETVVTISPPLQTFGSSRVVPPPGAFLQATADGEEALAQEVLRICSGADHIVDLFAGCGTFTFPLATMASVDAFEGDAEMIDALDRGWRESHGLKRVRATTRDLFRRPLEPDELIAFDAAVIDPPRAGAAAQIDRLVASKVPTVAMVSCNAVTFARDASLLLAGGYRMGEVLVVDQFRWSSHVEMVAAFTRP